MVLVVTLKKENWKHRYERVTKFSVFPKEEVREEVDKTTYEEMDELVFRMYFEDGEQATFSVNPNFNYKVLSYKS